MDGTRCRARPYRIDDDGELGTVPEAEKVERVFDRADIVHLFCRRPLDLLGDNEAGGIVMAVEIAESGDDDGATTLVRREFE